jgi:hypothetical protein
MVRVPPFEKNCSRLIIFHFPRISVVISNNPTYNPTRYGATRISCGNNRVRWVYIFEQSNRQGPKVPAVLSFIKLAALQREPLADYCGHCHWAAVISCFYVQRQVITCCLLDKGIPRSPLHYMSVLLYKQLAFDNKSACNFVYDTIRASEITVKGTMQENCCIF